MCAAALRVVASGVLLLAVSANECGQWVETSLCMGTISRASPAAVGDTTWAFNQHGNSANDHFYRLVIDDDLANCAADSYLKISTCGSAYDTYLRILSAYYAYASEIVACDDCGGCGVQTVLNHNQLGVLTAGEYILQVEGFSSYNGQYTLELDYSNCTSRPSPAPSTPSPSVSLPPTPRPTTLGPTYSPAPTSDCPSPWTAYESEWRTDSSGTSDTPGPIRCFALASDTDAGLSAMTEIGDFTVVSDYSYRVTQSTCASMCDALNASLPCDLNVHEAEWLYETFRGPVDYDDASSRRVHAGYYQRRVCEWAPIAEGCVGTPLWARGGLEGVGVEPDTFDAGVDDATYYDDSENNYRKVHCASQGIDGYDGTWTDKPFRMESVSCLDDRAACVCEKGLRTSETYRKWVERGYNPRSAYDEASFALWLTTAILFGLVSIILLLFGLVALDDEDDILRPRRGVLSCNRNFPGSNSGLMCGLFALIWACVFFMMSSAMRSSHVGPSDDTERTTCNKDLGTASQVFLWFTLGVGGPPCVWYAAHCLAQCYRQARAAYENRLRRKLVVDLRNVKVERQVSHAQHAKDEISGVACTLCQIRVANAVNVPCGHCFLCFDCNERFRADAGPICNACREPSTTKRPRQANLRHLELQAPLGESELEMNNLPQTFSGLRKEIRRISDKRDQSHARMLAAKKALLCAQCATNRVDSVFEACGHSELCFECATAHQAAHGEECATCKKPSPLKRLVLEKTCDVCFDDVGLEYLYTAGVCGHLLCTTCSIEYVRGALGNVSDEIFTAGLRCPMHMAGCEKMLETRNLRALIGKQVREENRATIVPLKPEEHARLERFTYEVGIPFDHRFHCANEKCARMFDVDIASVLAAARAGSARPKVICPHCNTASCARCKILWHEMLSCDEVEAMKSAQKDSSGTDAYIDATSKACPRCGFRISHYHGHACHHIRPGTGCTNCGHHFCYRCLRPGHSGSACGCRLFCDNSNIQSCLVQEPYPHDSRCSCPICPDCRPRQPCPQCDGNCVVCQGAVPHGPTSLVKKK